MGPLARTGFWHTLRRRPLGHPCYPRVCGEPRVGKGWRGLARADPRVCGGTPPSSVPISLKVGLSPRVRGTLRVPPIHWTCGFLFACLISPVPPTARACVLDDDVPLVPCPLSDLPLVALFRTHMYPPIPYPLPSFAVAACTLAESSVKPRPRSPCCRQSSTSQPSSIGRGVRRGSGPCTSGIP